MQLTKNLFVWVPKLKTQIIQFWLLLYPDSTGGGGAANKENSIKTTVKNRHNTKV